VNGCQTVTSLYQLNEEGKLSKDVDILTRIIEISDYEQRSKITEFLNSQNPVKSSYFIANNSIVRDLQTALLEQDYFLERQINEAKHKAQYVDGNIVKNKK
ncbi:AIPR family protein, partial [Klebsiella pneumoniae]